MDRVLITSDGSVVTDEKTRFWFFNDDFRFIGATHLSDSNMHPVDGYKYYIDVNKMAKEIVDTIPKDHDRYEYILNFCEYIIKII